MTTNQNSWNHLILISLISTRHWKHQIRSYGWLCTCWPSRNHYCYQQSCIFTWSSNNWKICQEFYHIDTERVEVPCFLQSKSYLKIIGIPYHLENTNTSILVDVVEFIIRSNHIFNNIAIASRLHVIKVSSKSDMAIVWLDIWDIQSGNNAKGLINKCFNVESYITTIHRMNMNPEVPHCKSY